MRRAVRVFAVSFLSWLALSTQAVAGSPATPTPFFVADVNCDNRSSAADFTAAVIVSGDGTSFRDCSDANPFRDRVLDESEFLPMQHDLFGTFDAPNTPTPTRTATVTPTGAATSTATPSQSPTDSPTPVPTPTPTATAQPAATSTATSTRTATATLVPSPTPTPTGLAQQISGTWFADWGNRPCFLDGQFFDALQDVAYRVTAVRGRLDIEIVGQGFLARDLVLVPISGGAMVSAHLILPSGLICPVTRVEQEFEFDYEFTFRTNGAGAATADWTFGFNTLCAVCRVFDSATLQRVQ